jgi:tetratricopeptide (TPR) repeat protein
MIDRRWRQRRRMCVGALRILMLMAVFLSPSMLVAQAAVPAQKGWKRLQTPNFEVLGNTGDRDLRMVGERLELFRDAMGLLFASAARQADARTRVLVFRNHKAYDPFKPQYEGKPAALGGYFLGGEDVNHITLTVENRDANFQVIQHEYVHLLMADSLGSTPAWVSEGIAEYYSSFTTSADGRTVHLGIPHASHVYELRETFLPLQTIVSTTRESSQYNERDKKGTFYAESWALVHYLLLGNGQKYSPHAAAFVGALAGGKSLDQATRETLGIEAAQLEKELRAYVDRGQFMMQRAKFDERLARLEKLPIEPVSEGEAHAALGDLLQRLHRDPEAESQFLRALELDAESSLAHAGLAAVRLRQDRRPDALAHLERATRSPDATFVTHYRLAALLAGADGASTDMVRQEAALRRVVQLNPRFAEGWHLLGAIKGRDPASSAEARALVQKAIDIAPGRERYLLTMAYLYANGQNYKVAATLSRTLSQQAVDEDVRTQARTLHEQVLAYERHVAQAAAAQAAHGASAAPEDVRFEARPDAPALIPDLRQMQSGEVRRPGFLVAIECSDAGVVFRIDTEGRAVALKARRFEDVEFITYREDLQGAVECGRRKTLDAVYVTWRGEPTVAGLADAIPVAIEFLPKGFVPPRLDPLPD